MSNMSLKAMSSPPRTERIIRRALYYLKWIGVVLLNLSARKMLYHNLVDISVLFAKEASENPITRSDFM